MRRIVGKYITSVIVILILIISSLALTSLIPSNKIKNNVEKSANIFMEEGQNKTVRILGRYIDIDNFTNAIKINQAYSIDSTKPLYSVLMTMQNYDPEINKRIISETAEFTGTMPVKELYDLVNGNAETAISYARYWHRISNFLKTFVTNI